MDPKTAYARRDDVVFLDVREPDEWQAGHIEGALHIPMGQLNQRIDELDAEREFVAVCRSGNRSGAVTEAMKRAGYEVENLDGGMQAWSRDGLPFVADGGGDPRVA
ncbi:rhodanese-like domain-containing protein [Egicoccus sp. AB-alg6-2]|uniref:rhodanese-like domain-containing protein n=1 Tax=Egicoccus sp. AB-alg6-2 TaxID=3242692 RepID=UPI00359E3EFA